MDSMKMRVSELEKECESMKQEIEKLGRTKNNIDNNIGTGNGGGGGRGGKTWGNVTRRFGFKVKSQMCSAEEGSVGEQQSKGSDKVEKVRGRDGGRERSKRLSPER